MQALRPNGKRYTRGEEIFNFVTHTVGAVLAIGGTGAMLLWAALKSDAWGVASAAVFCATLIVLYTMSSLYHAVTGDRVKGIFRIFDHCSIFLLIAGTYTPFTLVTLRGPLGFCIFGAIWGSAVLGIVLNAISIERFRIVSMICYVGMGWGIVAAIRPLLAALAPGGVILLVAGGVVYTVGIVFYAMRKVKYMHPIWHLFVLGGSILHYLSILLYVLPVR